MPLQINLQPLVHCVSSHVPVPEHVSVQLPPAHDSWVEPEPLACASQPPDAHSSKDAPVPLLVKLQPVPAHVRVHAPVPLQAHASPAWHAPSVTPTELLAQPTRARESEDDNAMANASEERKEFIRILRRAFVPSDRSVRVPSAPPMPPPTTCREDRFVRENMAVGHAIAARVDGETTHTWTARPLCRRGVHTPRAVRRALSLRGSHAYPRCLRINR